MAKKKRDTKLVRKGNQSGIQIQEEIDDSLLPSPEELQKYKELDENIINWLKERAEKEQNFRHKFNLERLKLTGKHIKNEALINTLGLIFAFVIMVLSLPISAYLILNGHTIVGSILGGATLLTVITAFLSKVKSNNNEKTVN